MSADSYYSDSGLSLGSDSGALSDSPRRQSPVGGAAATGAAESKPPPREQRSPSRRQGGLSKPEPRRGRDAATRRGSDRPAERLGRYDRGVRDHPEVDRRRERLPDRRDRATDRDRGRDRDRDRDRGAVERSSSARARLREARDAGLREEMPKGDAATAKVGSIAAAADVERRDAMREVGGRERGGGDLHSAGSGRGARDGVRSRGAALEQPQRTNDRYARPSRRSPPSPHAPSRERSDQPRTGTTDCSARVTALAAADDRASKERPRGEALGRERYARASPGERRHSAGAARHDGSFVAVKEGVERGGSRGDSRAAERETTGGATRGEKTAGHARISVREPSTTGRDASRGGRRLERVGALAPERDGHTSAAGVPDLSRTPAHGVLRDPAGSEATASRTLKRAREAEDGLPGPGPRRDTTAQELASHSRTLERPRPEAASRKEQRKGGDDRSAQRPTEDVSGPRSSPLPPGRSSRERDRGPSGRSAPLVETRSGTTMTSRQGRDGGKDERAHRGHHDGLARAPGGALARRNGSDRDSDRDRNRSCDRIADRGRQHSDARRRDPDRGADCGRDRRSDPGGRPDRHDHPARDGGGSDRDLPPPPPRPHPSEALRGSDSAAMPPPPPAAPKAAPEFGLSGLLAAETKKNEYGRSVKYAEPSDAAKPNRVEGWFLYEYKGAELLHQYKLANSKYVMGKDAMSGATIIARNPSISREHCVIQFRRRPAGIVPYLMDLESTYGTHLRVGLSSSNDSYEKLKPACYYELRSRDVFKLGNSVREYVVMRGDEVKDKDVKVSLE